MSRTETDQKYIDLIAECDLLIKSGKINEATSILSNLVLSHVPRAARVGIAMCCRRTGLIALGLRLLQPIIRVQKAWDEPAVAKEVCEYSALLSRNGSLEEAFELLKGIDTQSAPEALLYQGQCHVLNWEYSESIKYFKSFLLSSADDYSKLIAQVNLISGYIALFRMNEAVETLEKTIELAQKMGALRLLANCYELWGQVEYWRGDFAKARGQLKRALDILDASQSHDQLLVLKTEAMMASVETNSIEPLLQVRKLAVQRKHWEGVRDIDLFILKLAPNQSQLDYLFYGTPKAAYRRRIEMLVQARPSPSYILGSENGPQLNLQTGRLLREDGLPLGKQTHQVISALIRDFYAPISIGTLFYELYPEEYFDIDSSPLRIRQAILRTREWLQKKRIPASIQQSEGTYRLLITGDFGIKIELEHEPVSPTIVRWEQLKERFAPGTFFTSEEVCNQLGWSRTTFRRLADWAFENQQLSRWGAGKSTSYQIISGKKGEP